MNVTIHLPLGLSPGEQEKRVRLMTADLKKKHPNEKLNVSWMEHYLSCPMVGGPANTLDWKGCTCDG